MTGVQTCALPICGENFGNDDIVVLNPSEDDIEVMRTRMATRKAQRILYKRGKYYHAF